MTLQKFYTRIGQDYQVVLNRMMGKEDFLAMLLRTFLEDDTFGHLAEAVEEGNGAEIFQHAHTIKGVASNLGLTPLYDKVAVLAELTRGGGSSGAKEAFAAAEAEYKQTICLLKTVEL